jgi:hypothetical protein
MKNEKEALCPEWCQSHFGVHGETESVLNESRAHESEPATVGKHTALILKEKHLWLQDMPCQAVRVEQDEAVSGRRLPVIEFWHGHPSVRNREPDSGIAWSPLTHHSITAIEARRLGQALLDAAKVIEKILPERCHCGEPVAVAGDECKTCWYSREWQQLKEEGIERTNRLSIVPDLED